MQEIKIDEELKKLITPLSPEEYKALEDSIIREGCRDALVVWGDTLIDGHHRLEICQKNKIDYTVINKDFSRKSDVKTWIIKNPYSRLKV